MSVISQFGLPSLQSDATPVLGGNLAGNAKNIANVANINSAESSNNTIGTAAKTTFYGNGAALVGLQASGALLTALNATTGSGFIVIKNDGSTVTRTPTVSLPLTITNANGVLAAPALAINAASTINDGYMTALNYSKLQNINGGVWVLYENGNSDNYGAGEDATTCGAALLLAAQFAQPGQEVLIGIGDYDVGSNQIILGNRVRMKGHGPHKTNIISTLNSSNLASIALGTDSVISDLSIKEYNGLSVLGGGPADTAFTGAIVENVHITGTHPDSGTKGGVVLQTAGTGNMTLRRVEIDSFAEGVVVGNSNWNKLYSIDTEIKIYGNELVRNHGYRIKNNGSGCGIEIYGGQTSVSGNVIYGNIGLCNEGSGNTSIKAFNHVLLASGLYGTYDILGNVHLGQCTNKTGVPITNISGTLTYLDYATLPVSRGGTGLSSFTSGRIPHATATDVLGTNANLAFSSNTLKVGSAWLTSLGLEGQGAFDVGSLFGLNIYGVPVTVSDGFNDPLVYINASGVSIGTGVAANSKAILELASIGSGFLMPRMTTTQRDAIISPPEGLEVYNITTHARNVYNNTVWIGEKKFANLPAVAPAIPLTTGDGKYYFVVPTPMSGTNIVRVHAAVMTAGTTNTTDVQIARIRGGTPVDVLSTKLTIDSAEIGSDTAATPPVIDTSNDDLQPNDFLRVDIDAISVTPPNGLVITIEAE